MHPIGPELPISAHVACSVSAVVCAACKPRPCPSYSRRRDRNNCVHWHSLYREGGVRFFVPPVGRMECASDAEMETKPVRPLKGVGGCSRFRWNRYGRCGRPTAVTHGLRGDTTTIPILKQLSSCAFTNCYKSSLQRARCSATPPWMKDVDFFMAIVEATTVHEAICVVFQECKCQGRSPATPVAQQFPSTPSIVQRWTLAPSMGPT